MGLQISCVLVNSLSIEYVKILKDFNIPNKIMKNQDIQARDQQILALMQEKIQHDLKKLSIISMFNVSDHMVDEHKQASNSFERELKRKSRRNLSAQYSWLKVKSK